MSEQSVGDTDRPEGQVCPNDDCNIDQRFPGFHGFCCPECACRLVVACSKCDSGAVERFDESPVCPDHAPELVADGGYDVDGIYRPFPRNLDKNQPTTTTAPISTAPPKPSQRNVVGSITHRNSVQFKSFLLTEVIRYHVNTTTDYSEEKQ